MSPPETVIQASTEDATLRNGNPNDGFNDALTSSYVPHANDPEMWTMTDIAHDHEYGPAVAGPISHQGEGDTDAFSYNDVHQGSIGNCYFMAALTSIAQQQPDLLRNAISGPNPDGTYNVTLYTDAGWEEDQDMVQQTITITSSFAVWEDLSHSNQPGFAAWSGTDAHADGADRDAAGNEELWVNLIEKAYAALLGGYEKVDGMAGGYPMMALEALTGERHYDHYFDGVPDHYADEERSFYTRDSSRTDQISNDELSQTIIQNLADGNAVTAETRGHAVTVLSANEETITLRDQQATYNGDADGLSTYTWEEFRSRYMKFTTRTPNQ